MVEADAEAEVLVGVEVLRRGRVLAAPSLAQRAVALFRHDLAGRVGNGGGGAEVVGLDVAEGRAGPRRHQDHVQFDGSTSSSPGFRRGAFSR